MADQKRHWRLIDLLQWTSAHLEKKGIDSPRLTAERLLAHVLGLKRVDLYVQFDRLLTKEELQRFKVLLQRRLRREPLQYVLGEAEFYGLPFKVTPAVLIPRPETEVLVEQVLRRVRARCEPEHGLEILDVGTGSGNIAVVLAVELQAARVTALDVSADALAVALENARRHGVDDRIELAEQEFVDFARQAAAAGRRFDVVVSNPPYVSREEFETLAPEVREHEPRVALLAEGDALGFFDTLAEWGPRLLRGQGLVAVEVGFGQAEAVAHRFRQHGLAEIEIHADLSGIDRVVTAALAQSEASTGRSLRRPPKEKEPITA